MKQKITAPIVEIFKSLEGEGNFIGIPTIFVRLAGCTVGCKTCDSKQTWGTDGFPVMTVTEVIKEIRNFGGVERISITGGEPLLHEEFVTDLCNEIYDEPIHYGINLETSGTLFPNSIFGHGNSNDYFDQISMDIKTPSSGVKLNDATRGHILNAIGLNNVYTKAVIGSKEDLEFVLDLIAKTEYNSLVLTPCERDGKFFSVDEMFQVFNSRKYDFSVRPIKIIAQQHKLLNFR